MKKRLLLSFAAVIGAMTSFAYNVGDYVYTNTAKFKVIGENILTNGNFAANYDGWKDYADGALSPDYWSIEAGASEDGGNVIQCTNGAADLTGNYMYQAVPYESGKSYIITFKVKGVDPVTSSITPQTTNYIDVYANADGTLNKTAENFCQVATTDAVTAEWTSYSYSFTDTITGGSTGYIVVTFGQLTAGTQVSDVEVREVTEVFDTRISDREFAYAEALLAIDGMVNGKDELQGTLESIRGFFESPESEDPSAAQDALNSFVEAETEFLNANSYDLTSQIDGKALWTTKLQRKGGGETLGDWYLDGDARWFHDPATDPSIRHYIQGSFNLSAGTAKIVKILPPGKYFFSCESKGYRMAGTSKTLGYIPDYTYVVEGAAVFIGNDSVKFNLDQRNFERHFVVADVAEGETLNAGFWHPATSVDNKLGGTVYMQAPVLRIIGDNSDGQMEAYIVNYATLNEIAVQANALRVMLDSAITVKEKAEFPWGKDALQENITYYEGAYASLSAKQPGEDLFAEAADSLMQSMRLVRTAIQDYYALNAPYTDLKAQLVIANESYNNPQNAAGDKATFLAVINKAQALVDGVTAEYSEEVANNMIAAKTELVEAQFAFEASTASLANPSEIEIVNPYFAQFTNQSNVEGWTMTGQSDNGRWKKGTLPVYENATHLTMWRGYTAFSLNKASQNVALLRSGVYVLSCQASACNEKGSTDGDRTVNSGVYYYAKLADAADSIGAHMVHTDLANYLDNVYSYGNYYPEQFAVVFEKTGDAEETVEFGFDGMNNLLCNTYNFGGNHVRYMGPADKFKTDLDAALAASLAKATTEYESLAQLAEDATIAADCHLTYSRIYINLGYAVEYANGATTLNEKMTAYLKLADALKNADILVSGVKGIVAEPAANVQKGVFTLSGVKVADSKDVLPKGLYIVDGKKVIVK